MSTGRSPRRGDRKRLYRPSPEASDDLAFSRILVGRIIDKARIELAGDAREA